MIGRSYTATAAWKYIQAGDIGWVDQMRDGDRFKRAITTQDITQAPMVLCTENLMKARPPQVAVNQQNLATDIRHGNAEVASDSRFAVARGRTGDHNDLRFIVIVAWQENRSQRRANTFGHQRWLTLPSRKFRPIRFGARWSLRSTQ